MDSPEIRPFPTDGLSRQWLGAVPVPPAPYTRHDSRRAIGLWSNPAACTEYKRNTVDSSEEVTHNSCRCVQLVYGQTLTLTHSPSFNNFPVINATLCFPYACNKLVGQYEVQVLKYCSISASQEHKFLSEFDIIVSVQGPRHQSYC